MRKGVNRGCPTEFMGVIFRSRLEAEWALYFHRSGVRWVYEPCRIYLPYQRHHTPDFALPEHRLLIQVKPGLPTGSQIQLAGEAGRILGVPIYFACGHPEQHPTYGVTVKLGEDVWGYSPLSSLPLTTVGVRPWYVPCERANPETRYVRV